MNLPPPLRWPLLLITLAATIGFSPAGQAQTDAASTNYVVTVTTDRPEAVYKQGETVTYTITLSLDKKPLSDVELSWIISKDGVPPQTTGKIKLADGAATVTGKLDEPGVLQCRAVFYGPNKLVRFGLAGAAYDPLQIKPSLPVPDDFDAFWADQKKQLAAVPINAKLTPVKSPYGEVECFDLQADCIGAPVSGYFARPVGAKPKSLPVLLSVHGAGVRSSQLGGMAGWAKGGVMALDINAHGIPNGKPDSFYTDLANGDLKDYRYRGRESRDSCYFKGMFLRLVRAIDFLTAQPEWDGHIVIVQGTSQGGAQSIVAAGLDPRVTFFAAGVPAMCDHTGVVVGRVNGWPKLVPNGTDGKPDPKVLEAARYFDAMNFAIRTKAPGCVTVGYIDTVCPPSSVYAAYNNLTTKKEIYHEPLSGHAMSPKAGEFMRKCILAYIEEAKKAAH